MNLVSTEEYTGTQFIIDAPNIWDVMYKTNNIGAIHFRRFPQLQSLAIDLLCVRFVQHP